MACGTFARLSARRDHLPRAPSAALRMAGSHATCKALHEPQHFRIGLSKPVCLTRFANAAGGTSTKNRLATRCTAMWVSRQSDSWPVLAFQVKGAFPSPTPGLLVILSLGKRKQLCCRRTVCPPASPNQRWLACENHPVLSSCVIYCRCKIMTCNVCAEIRKPLEHEHFRCLWVALCWGVPNDKLDFLTRSYAPPHPRQLWRTGTVCTSKWVRLFFRGPSKMVIFLSGLWEMEPTSLIQQKGLTPHIKGRFPITDKHLDPTTLFLLVEPPPNNLDKKRTQKKVPAKQDTNRAPAWPTAAKFRAERNSRCRSCV